MAAARRSSGSGTVVALIIFVVLAFVGIFASIWFFQQYSTVSQAARQNQAQFAATVGTAFVEHGWRLPVKEAPEYGLEYEREAYEEVVEQLSKARTYEELAAKLGWESLGGMNDRLVGLEQALSDSPVQSDTERPHITVKGLLERYESEYVRLTQNDVPQLQRELAAEQDLVAQKTADFEREREYLLDQLSTQAATHAEAMAASTRQFTEMERLYSEARVETQQSQSEFDAAQDAWRADRAKLNLDVTTWKDRYLEVLGGGEVTTLKAGGGVLRVDASYEFVMLGGGKDAQMRKNTRAVVYSESRSGARVRKGEVLVTQVFPNTSLATVVGLQKDQRMLVGDLFVAEALWDAYYHPEAAEVAQVAPEQPMPAQPEPEEVAPEVAAPEAMEEMEAPSAEPSAPEEETVPGEAVEEEEPLDFF